MEKFINMVSENRLEFLEKFLRYKVDYYNKKRAIFHVLFMKQNEKKTFEYYIYRILYNYFSKKFHFYVDALLKFLEGK